MIAADVNYERFNNDGACGPAYAVFTCLSKSVFLSVSPEHYKKKL
jgi:hypothetical protein